MTSNQGSFFKVHVENHLEISAFFETTPVFFGHLNSPPNKAQKKDPQAAPPSIVELKVAKHYLNAWSPLDVWRHVADFDFIFTCIYIYNVSIYIDIYCSTLFFVLSFTQYLFIYSSL